MQIKNFEALLKCGFEYNENMNWWELVGDKHNYLQETEYISIVGKDNSLSFNPNLVTPEDAIDLTIEMTKAGCFDEPVKTLSELGWELYEYDSEMKCYLKKLDTYATAYLTLELEYSTYYVYKYDENEKFSYSVSNELHKAIMLEMEEIL